MFPAKSGYLPPLPAFPIAVTPPDVDPDEGTQQAVCFAGEWLPYVLAALASLTLPTTWTGDEADVLLAQQRASLLLSLVGSPDEDCGGGGSCPYDIRYDEEGGHVQVSPDGGTTWEDADSLDPRRINQYPPPEGADPSCDAAFRMAAALEEIVSALYTAIDGGAVAADIGALIILWLAVFAGFAVLLALAVAAGAVLFSVGTVDFYTAFNGFDWDNFACHLKCYLDADGVLTEAGYAAFLAGYFASLTATQQTILNAILLVAGWGALNDFASTRDETDDCAGCTSCGWVFDLYPDQHPELWNWIYTTFRNCSGTTLWNGGQYGTADGTGWHSVWRDGTHATLAFGGQITIPAGSVLTKVWMPSFILNGGNLDNAQKSWNVNQYRKCFDGPFYSGFNILDGLTITGATVQWWFQALQGGMPGQTWRIPYVRFEGTGVNPFL